MNYEDWVKRDPELAENEQKQPFLRLMLVADLWFARATGVQIDVEDFRQIVGQQECIISNFPLDSVYTSSRGYIGRQIGSNDPSRLGLTWMFRQNLVSEVIVPLNMFSYEQGDFLNNSFDGYEYTDKFRSLLKEQGHKQAYIVDVSLLFAVIVGVVEIQRRLLRKAGWTGGYLAKARLINVWRTVPFLDVEAILDRFSTHGVPMCLERIITSLPGTEPETFIQVGVADDDALDERAIVLAESVRLFAPVALAYGLPQWLDVDPGLLPSYPNDLLNAALRAIEVQRRRSGHTQ